MNSFVHGLGRFPESISKTATAINLQVLYVFLDFSSPV